MRLSITPEAKCLASIAILADGGLQRNAERFGMAQSTFSLIFREFMDAVWELRDNWICLPGY